MRTEADLKSVYALLERQAQAYLADSMPELMPDSMHSVIDDAGPASVVPLLDRPTDRGPRRLRSRTLVAAAAVLVATTAIGAVALRDANSPNKAAGVAAMPMCVTPLPAVWRAALDARPITVDGRTVDPVSIDPDGTAIISWTAADGSLGLGEVSGTNHVRQIARVTIPTGQEAIRIVADAHNIVYELKGRGGDAAGSAARYTTDIVAVDRHTGDTTDLLAAAPVPTGFVSPVGSGGSWAVLQDGVFYWLEGPKGDDAPLTVLSYNFATKAYAARPTGQAAVFRNALGISWTGGSVPVDGLPPALPPAGEHKLTVQYDGSSVAWSLNETPSTLYWADAGQTRVLSQHLMSHLAVEAVVGPYVLLTYDEGDDSDRINGDIQLLDTRTGALADTGIDGLSDGASANGRIAFTRDDRNLTMILLDTNKLPGLTCDGT